jgi:secondary thiamine-phosphate synthase enzyme
VTVFSRSFDFATRVHDQVVDVTKEVEHIVAQSGARDGLVCVFTPHATAAITINENDDPNIGVDLITALRKVVADHDGWLHDRIDGNAASHIKSAIVGPSQTIPLIDGRLALGRWQNVFFCELDGPRATRRVIVSVVS